MKREKSNVLTLDRTGFGSHGDYMFGWKDDSLQRAMDSPCYVNCPTLKTQSVSEMNKCSVPNTVDEDFDGCKWSRWTPKRGELVLTQSYRAQGVAGCPDGCVGFEISAIRVPGTIST